MLTRARLSLRSLHCACALLGRSAWEGRRADGKPASAGERRHRSPSAEARASCKGSPSVASPPRIAGKPNLRLRKLERESSVYAPRAL